MKILITSDWYAPAINGVVTSVVNLRNQLQTRGHEVRVLTLAQNISHMPWHMQGTYQDGIWYLPSISAGWVYPGARMVSGPVRNYIEEIIQWRPDVVHSQCEFATFRPAKIIAEKTGARFCHTYHTVYENYTHYFSPHRSFGKKAAALFSKWICNQTDAVIAPTQKVKYLLEGYHIDRPVYVVPSGIDCSQFARAHRKAPLRDNAQALCTLIFAGRLAREKNIEELLLLLACRRDLPYRLLLVGDGPYRPALEHLTAQLGISERVTFVGMVSPRSIAQWYQRGAIFVSASTSETQGLTLPEALASGLPAVCRKDLCLDGVIENGRNGWQFENAQEFYSALAQLQDPAVYRRMSANALRSASMFDQSYFADRILAVYAAQPGKIRNMPLPGTSCVAC